MRLPPRPDPPCSRRVHDDHDPALHLPAGEPAAGPWRSYPVQRLVDLLTEIAPEVRDRPRVVAVDGRAGSGKTTLAGRLVTAAHPTAVVHTDDVAWHHSFFDWAELLAHHVLEPLRDGQPVHYRPPGWQAKGRPGAIDVPAGLELVVVEGVGAGRRELSHLLDAVFWVQSDYWEAERKGLDRDVQTGVNGDAEEAARFWQRWQDQERLFLADQRPWDRAFAIVRGTTTLPHDPERVALAPALTPPTRTAERS